MRKVGGRIGLTPRALAAPDVRIPGTDTKSAAFNGNPHRNHDSVSDAGWFPAIRCPTLAALVPWSWNNTVKLVPTGKYAVWIYGALIVCTLPCAAANDSAPEHYLQSCVNCHVRITGGEGELLYERKERLVNNYQELVKRVIYCGSGTGVTWDTRQIEQVVHYLNARFYRFSPPADAD